MTTLRSTNPLPIRGHAEPRALAPADETRALGRPSRLEPPSGPVGPNGRDRDAASRDFETFLGTRRPDQPPSVTASTAGGPLPARGLIQLDEARRAMERAGGRGLGDASGSDASGTGGAARSGGAAGYARAPEPCELGLERPMELARASNVPGITREDVWSHHEQVGGALAQALGTDYLAMTDALGFEPSASTTEAPDGSLVRLSRSERAQLDRGERIAQVPHEVFASTDGAPPSSVVFTGEASIPGGDGTIARMYAAYDASYTTGRDGQLSLDRLTPSSAMIELTRPDGTVTRYRGDSIGTALQALQR